VINTSPGGPLRKTLTLTILVFILIIYVVPSNGRAAERVDLIIRGGTVVTMDGSSRVIENGAVAVKSERIVAVGTAAEVAAKYAAARTIDATAKVVMPGLINTHSHVPMVLFRGIADDLLLMEWLQKYIFPAEAKNVDEQFVRWGTRLGCLEMIQGGTTTYVDMYYFEDAIADETARAGMRAVLGETLIDFPAPDNKTWDAGMTYVEKFAAKWKGHALITPAIAPHAAYTVSTDHLKQAHSFSERAEVPLVIHVAEDPAEVKTIQERYGSSSVAYLERIGLLDSRVIAAHMIWPTSEDIATLAKRGVGVAHCPQSNMKLAGGAAPVPTVLNAREALEMATIRGARAIHQEKEIGSLEPGKRADLIVVGMDSIHQIPLYNVYSQLVYATKASDVETVVINGKVVMQNRRVLTIDERSVRAKAVEYRDRIRKSVTPQ